MKLSRPLCSAVIAMDGDIGVGAVEPGMTGTLTHTFDPQATVEIGCHEPGHFAGGLLPSPDRLLPSPPGGRWRAAD